VLDNIIIKEKGDYHYGNHLLTHTS